MLTSAAFTKLCPQLRLCYVIVLRYCEPADPLGLFEKHWEEWTDDFAIRYKEANPSPEQLRLLVLLDVESMLQEGGKNLVDYGLPEVGKEERAEIENLIEQCIPDADFATIEVKKRYFFPKN